MGAKSSDVRVAESERMFLGLKWQDIKTCCFYLITMSSPSMHTFLSHRLPSPPTTYFLNIDSPLLHGIPQTSVTNINA